MELVIKPNFIAEAELELLRAQDEQLGVEVVGPPDRGRGDHLHPPLRHTEQPTVSGSQSAIYSQTLGVKFMRQS